MKGYTVVSDSLQLLFSTRLPCSSGDSFPRKRVESSRKESQKNRRESIVDPVSHNARRRRRRTKQLCIVLFWRPRTLKRFRGRGVPRGRFAPRMIINNVRVVCKSHRSESHPLGMTLSPFARSGELALGISG